MSMPRPRDPSSLRPQPFPEATHPGLGAPASWDESIHGPCDPLPVLQGQNSAGLPVFVSKWKVMGLRERLRVLLTGEIWLTVCYHGQPPVALNTESPLI